MRIPLPLPQLLMLLGSLLLSDSSWASACKLACKGAPCELQCKDGKPCPGGAPTQPALDRWQFAASCEGLEVTNGVVQLRYMHKNRWFIPPALNKGQRLDSIFASYPADPCSVLTAQCVQTAMAAKQAAVGGHGIDSRVSKPGGEGDPCSLGLPCGSVLPSGQTLQLRLTDPALQGQLLLRVARGSPPAGMPAEMAVAVQAGRASLDGRWLQPGGLYVYQFSDASGRPRASGEFSLLSQSMLERLRKLSAQREQQQGMSAEQAWYDTLLENQLLWDALQIDLGSTP